MGAQGRGIWQMPQGGIIQIRISARRRRPRAGRGNRHPLRRVHRRNPAPLTYDLPRDLLGVALKGRYRGQRQWWFAMRFTGNDSDIDIAAKHGTKAEFDDWAWRDIDELPALVVPFKRDMYETVIAEFRHLATPAGQPDAVASRSIPAANDCRTPCPSSFTSSSPDRRPAPRASDRRGLTTARRHARDAGDAAAVRPAPSRPRSPPVAVSMKSVRPARGAAAAST